MNRYLRWGLIGLSVLVVLAATGAVFPMLFYLNDDVMMRSILSGAYLGVPDGHAVYMKYPLTGLLALLYRVTDHVPWFSLFLAGCFWLSASLVLGRLAEAAGNAEGPGRGERAGICLCMGLACAVFFLPQYVALHYTVVAAVLGGCGICLVLLKAERAALAPLLLCWCVRSQIFWLSLPFLGMALLWALLDRWEEEGRKLREVLKTPGLWKFPVMLALGILACSLWDGAMYSSEEWRQYREFNEARTELYDYRSLLPYEQYETEYREAGIDRSQYRLLAEYDLGLSREADVGLLERACAVYDAQLGKSREEAAYWKDCLTEYYYHVRYTDKPYNALVLLAYGAVAVWALLQRKWGKLFLTACLGGGRSLIWLYLIWRGRFPERIEISLYLLELLLLAGLLCRMALAAPKRDALTGRGRREEGRKEESRKEESRQEEGREKKGRLARLCLEFAFLAMLVWAGFYQLPQLRERIGQQSERQEAWDVLTAYCQERDDAFYLLNVMSMVSYAGRVWEDTASEENYMLSGGWMSDSPLLWAKMEALGGADGGELLVWTKSKSGKRALYIAGADRDVSWLAQELGRRFGAVEAKLADSVKIQGKEVFRVYEFLKG